MAACLNARRKRGVNTFKTLPCARVPTAAPSLKQKPHLWLNKCGLFFIRHAGIVAP